MDTLGGNLFSGGSVSTVDIETLRQCIAVLDDVSTLVVSKELAYQWGWKDACAEIDKRLRQLSREVLA